MNLPRVTVIIVSCEVQCAIQYSTFEGPQSYMSPFLADFRDTFPIAKIQ